MQILLSYLASTLGGYLVVGLAVFAMRKTVAGANSIVSLPGGASQSAWRGVFTWYHVWVGFTERAIATTLFIWAPKQLGLFIGGWVALKLAAAWSRRDKDEHTQAHVLALVGTAISFSVAIAAGLYANPDSLLVLNAAPND